MSAFFEKLDLWLKIARGYTLSQSVVPYCFAIFLAYCSVKQINVLYSILGLLAVLFVQAATNMLDDYFDWKSGSVDNYKKQVEEKNVARTHKCFYLEQNLISLNTLLFVICALFVIAFLFGVIIFVNLGWYLLWFALISGVLAISYSEPHINLSSRGLGEISIGIIFGPLLMIAAYLVAGGIISDLIFYISAIMGLLIMNIAHTHAIMDFDADKGIDRLTLSTIVKTKENAILIQFGVYVLAYLIVLIAVFYGVFDKTCLIVFLSFPYVLELKKLMKDKTAVKKWWYGQIGNWEKYREEGSDWFMLRLCLSRNLLMVFIILFSISLLFS